MAITKTETINQVLHKKDNSSWIGNDPYTQIKLGEVTCTVEHNKDYPFMVSIDTDVKLSIKDLDAGCRGDFWFYSTTINGIDEGNAGGFTVPNATWSMSRRSHFDAASSNSGWVVKSGFYRDIRKVLGDRFNSHQWYWVPVKFNYAYTGYIYSIFGGWEIITSSSNVYTKSFPIYTPRVVGGNSSNWWGNASRGSDIAYRTVRFTANYGGLIQGNESHTVYFYVGGTLIGSQTDHTSGTISGSKYISFIGNQTWEIKCDGKTIASDTWYFKEPPPTKPTMGNVNNTTWSSINTTRSKTLSANWGVSDAGWRSGTITYNWKCYSTTYGKLGEGETTATSHSFKWDMPAQDVRDNIYWTVRAKTSGNTLGYSSEARSGNVEVFWAYTEPAKIVKGSVNPNRFQLFNGNTTISFNATSTIGAWGDRPGTRSVEYGLYKNGSVLKWYGRTNTSSTGQFSQSLSYSVPETDVNSTYNVIAHKRLGNTEYTTGSDPRWPTTGDNHVTTGNITFYEVIGKINGSLSLDPSIIISGISNKVNYNWTYDQQSSEKVNVYLEVYRIPTNKVTKTYQLDSNVTTSRSQDTSKTLLLVDPQEADAYEIRLKATITELLGNTHTYTLATLTPQVYNPPVGDLNIHNVSLPLPTYNATSLLAKQATDITWNYTYSFQGVLITKVTLTVNSKPFGREIFELPFDATTSPYYNNYTRVSTGDFALGSVVDAYMTIYYQIIGSSTTYSVQTNTFRINITPTRYVYFLARAGIGEQQLNKIHPLVNNVDKTSEKIHLD